MLWLKEIESGAAVLHSKRGFLHRLFWFPETSRDIPCSECMVTAEEMLTTVLSLRSVENT